MRHRRPPSLLACSLLPCAVALSAAGEPRPRPPKPALTASEPFDTGGAAMSLFTDGKGHYVALDGELSSERFFYGDAGGLFRQRVGSSGGAHDEKGGWTQRSMTFWDPRFLHGQASLDLQAGTLAVSCGARRTELRPVAADEAARILAAARLYQHAWRRSAYLLARDDRGRYFYVDRSNSTPDAKDFRLYAGPRGDLKLLRMTDVVSDSNGEIFATSDGKLRLVLNHARDENGEEKKDYTWVAGKSETRLLPLPLNPNAKLIYEELGVYSGARLGTPCDDL